MSKRFKCKICNKKFIDKYNLDSHQSVHTTETPFACPQCPYRGKTKKYLARHTRQIHKEKTGEHKCNVCGKFFHHQSNLKVHAMVHTGEKPHSCNVCGKTFRVTYSLNSHMLIHTNEKPFECSFCDYACRDSSTLRKHQNKHMGLEKIYECKICNKGYKSRAALKIHIAETHLNVDVRKFPCDSCDKVFKSKTHRKMHIESFHERALVCNCPICGRRLMNKNNLTAHMRTHLDERPFSCTHPGCQISFKDKNSLTKHSAIHNPELHFACTYCGRKFVRKTHVQRHERVMHVERRRGVQCDYCGSKFYSKNYLIKHIQTKHVHKQKFKYICDMCGLITHNKPSIVMHIKYGHSNDHDLQCKICDNNKVYKRHLYLKLHYWNTHSMRYKITRKSTNTKAAKKDKQKSPSVEIKVEQIEADSYEGIQLLDVDKHENEEDVNDYESLDYSKRVMSEDIAESVLQDRGHTKEVDFDEYFIRHVFAKEEDKTDENKNIGVNVEQNQFVKNRIKQIIIRTEKIEKAKLLREKRAKEKIEKKKREIEETRLREKREREELVELRRVREMYNERMSQAVAREKQNKEPVKIRYFKKTEDFNKNSDENATPNNESTENNEITNDISNFNDTASNSQNDDDNSAMKVNNTLHNKEKYGESQNNKSSDENFTQDNVSAKDTENIEKLSTIEIINILNNEKTTEKSKLNTFCDENFTENYAKNNEITENSSTNEINNTLDTEESSKNKSSDENSTQNKESDNYKEITKDLSTNEVYEVSCTENTENNRNNKSTEGNDTINNDSANINDITNDISINKIKNTLNIEDTIKKTFNDYNKTEINIKSTKRCEESYTNNNETKDLSVIQKTQINNFIDNEQELSKNIEAIEDPSKIIDGIEQNDEAIEDMLEEHATDDIFEQPLLERRVKTRNMKNIRQNGDKSKNENVKANKMEFKTFQCYICFKLYQTKNDLIDHCQEHFDICHKQTLTKCPICNHVTHKGITDHMKKTHDITVKIPFNKIKDRKSTKYGSRYCYNADGTIVEVIPSVKKLNKTASDEIDKRRRDLNNKSIAKTTLVKTKNDWIVKKEAIDIKFDVIPNFNDRDLHKLKVTDNDVDRLGQLSYLVKKKGLKMMFPCFKCDKICQNFCALKLHKRKHEDAPKPFKAKVYSKNKNIEVKKVKLNKSNRTAFPKPILNKHKCDAKLKEFFESNIRGGDVEFGQFLKIFNKMDREKVKDFADLEKRSDFGNHLDYYKDMENDGNGTENDVNETGNDINKMENDGIGTENYVNAIENDDSDIGNDVEEEMQDDSSN